MFIPDKLTLEERGKLVFTQGKYLAVREYYGYFINLYLVEDIFVEFWYSWVDNKIEKLELLEDLRKLDLCIFNMQKLERMEKNKMRRMQETML